MKAEVGYARALPTMKNYPCLTGQLTLRQRFLLFWKEMVVASINISRCAQLKSCTSRCDAGGSCGTVHIWCTLRTMCSLGIRTKARAAGGTEITRTCYDASVL